MKGFYHSFAVLAIRLLAAIYWNQTQRPAMDMRLIHDARDWLEKNE